MGTNRSGKRRKQRLNRSRKERDRLIKKEQAQPQPASADKK
jgi:hypothetical protein